MSEPPEEPRLVAISYDDLFATLLHILDMELGWCPADSPDLRDDHAHVALNSRRPLDVTDLATRVFASFEYAAFNEARRRVPSSYVCRDPPP